MEDAPKEISAESFVSRDPDGRVRLRLGRLDTAEHASARFGMVLYGPGGRERYGQP